MAGFTSTTPDEHVKLVFPDPDGTTRPPELAEDGETLVWPRPFPPFREYTIRRFDQAANQVWIDFVVHPGGLASDWAQRAEPGDTLWAAGPRSGEAVPAESGVHVLLADHTALPALARWLEEVADGVHVDVAVVVPDAGEEQPLATREGVTVTWYHGDASDGSADDLLGGHLERLDLPTDESAYLWAAGEAGMLKPVRRWARAHGFARGTCDIAGYWRRERTSSVTTTRR
ncbi:siderophore-interacting protein [Aeromicrobium alkaliterrae]|uniref:Siderophore-interacting protein n=2 Tax=Aeromicrobium alkaliterrae TaxID=302168 RepID=A0ABN2JG68_9ACTN